MNPKIGTYSMMKFITLLSMICLGSNSCGAQTPTPKPQLSVGVVVPLSGEMAYFGTALQHGIQMAVSEGLTRDITFTFEDDRSGERAATVSALHSLISKQKIKVVVLTGMPNAVVADPIVKKEGVIALSAWDSNQAIEKFSDNTLGFGWSNEKTGAIMASFASNSLKAQTAAVVVAHDEWSEIMGTAFSQTFNKAGGKIVFNDAVGLDDTDFRSLTAKIVRANPGVVYFPLYRASLLAFARQLKQSGYSGTLLSAEGISAAEVQQLGKLADGMYFTSAYLEDPAFEQKYKSRFGLSKVEVNLAHVALGHELAKFLNSCVETLAKNNQSNSADNLRSVMLSISVTGALGTTSFRGRKTTDRTQVILTTKDGKISLVPAQ